VLVRVMDPAGIAVEMTTNSVGNFFSAQPLSPPFTAEILVGKEVRERGPWNNEASLDAIRHFANGIDDDNPLWLDPDYTAGTVHKKIQAPPAFLVSVLYPILHGAPVVAPLSSLIGGVSFEWFQPIYAGDTLRAHSVVKEMFEKTNKAGRRLIFIIGEFTYENGQGETVATATGTMIRTLQEGSSLMYDREVAHYDEAAIAEIEAEYRAEKRTGSDPLHWEDVSPGDALPSMLRGPLTIGDMVAWNAALGPSYRAGRLGYLALLKGARAFWSKTPSSTKTSPSPRAEGCRGPSTMGSCASPGSLPTSQTGWETRGS